MACLLAQAGSKLDAHAVAVFAEVLADVVSLSAV